MSWPREPPRGGPLLLSPALWPVNHPHPARSFYRGTRAVKGRRSAVTTRALVELLVIDKPGVSAGCACSATDPALPAFAGDLEWLRWQGVSVRRIDPRVTGKGLGGDADALAAVAACGYEALPLIVVDGEVRQTGSYPDRERLAAIIAATESPDAEPHGD